ncbi:MAG: hypothetical protein ACREPS_05080 [Rhodanobacteraceae bacterium]
MLRPKAETAGELFARARAIAGDAFKDFKLPTRDKAEPVEPLEL